MESKKPIGKTFRYIDINSIDNKKHIITEAKELDVSNAPSRASRSVDVGDTLFSMVRPYLENIAYINEEYENCIASTGFFVCKPNQTLYSKFLYYLMLSSYVIDGLNAFMKGDNSPSINNDNIISFLYPIPPLAEQHRIVSSIESAFALIDGIETGKQDLGQFIKQTKFKVLYLAIHGKLVPQNPDDEPASMLLERIRKEQKVKKTTADISHYPFKVPESWAWTTLGKIVLSIKNGATIKQNKNASGIPITRIETISDGTVNYVRMGYANIFDSLDYASYILKDNDILMSHINSPVHVGKTAIYKPKEKNETIIHGMNLLCIRLQDTISSDFVNYFFNSQFFKDSINPYIKNAVNQASINISNLNSIQIPVPPLTEQHQIVSKIEQIFVQLNEIENSITN
ncbi:MAG: restriction endonuclease subunit S [Prevotellaceae bacterium]|nr:restriction endonuclease subunit S [Prevotellaceae bacterium]